MDQEIEEALQAFPDTFARATVACRFLQRFGGSREFLSITEEELLPMWAGYLRAALMDFAGMEEAIAADCRKQRITDLALTIEGTRNTMLILVHELRNLHVHVVQHRFDQSSRLAVSRYQGTEHEDEYLLITIPRSDLEQLLARREAKRFDKTDLRAAIEWLDQAQANWGIRDIVLESVKTYASLICGALSAGHKRSAVENGCLHRD